MDAPRVHGSPARTALGVLVEVDVGTVADTACPSSGGDTRACQRPCPSYLEVTGPLRARLRVFPFGDQFSRKSLDFQ